MDLASRIGANPAKAISRSNISFLGKGPTKNPLFQERLAGLENATEATLGKPETLFAAIDDAVGWMKDGKLNSIQSEILGHNLSGIAKIIDPPPLPTLPMASVSQLPTRGTGIKSLVPDQVQVPPGQLGKNVIDRRGSFDEMDKLLQHGILTRKGKTGTLEELIKREIKDEAAALKKFPKESHKFFGRPLKDKDFSEIDRLTMEGKLPDARGRTWNLKAPETGPERYNRLTGLDKSKPFQGWTPSVVPKVNIPASKINHQMIADKYGIDVELIRGKDWVEVLEIIRKLGYAQGGRIGYGDGYTVGSKKYNLNFLPSAELNLAKTSQRDVNVKNKNILMGLNSILNLGPYSAGVDYNKFKNKINVDVKGDTVWKDSMDDEMLAYKLGYNKDDLNMNLTANKDLNNFLFSLNKKFKRKPKYIFKKAQGGLAGILAV